MRNEVIKTVKDLAQKTEYKLLLATLIDFTEGKVTLYELEKTCMEWMYAYALQELRYRPKPSEPEIYTDFSRLAEHKRHKVMTEGGSERNKILEYRASCIYIACQNRVNKEWLDKMLRYFTEVGKVDKATQVRKELATWIGQN
jgi:hypothetical protein